MSNSVNTAVLEYLGKQNRPYSVIDIFNNLHKEYGKTAIIKACESLSAEDKIREKTYGKQKVYVTDQSQFPDVDDAEMSKMDHTITELSEKLKRISEEVRGLEQECRSLGNALSTEEAKGKLEEAEKQHISYAKKLAILKAGQNLVSPEEKEQIFKERNKYVKAWRKRKRMANDILGAILEGYPKTKKQLYEDIGIETDEDYSVSVPDTANG